MSVANVYAAARNGRADDDLVKVVIPSQRLIWLWVPKNAGGSISRSLLQAHGEEAIPCDLTLDQLWRLNDDMRSFRIVGFKRHPFTRVVSCWLNKIAEPASFNPRFLRKYPGLRGGMSFPDFAEWLNTPEGADERADVHWRSQHLELERATEILAFEDLPDAVAALGIRPADLSHRNQNTEAAAMAGLEVRPLLDWYDKRALRNIRQRYARDLEVLGYQVPDEIRPAYRRLVGAGAAPADGVGPARTQGDGQGRPGEQT